MTLPLEYPNAPIKKGEKELCQKGINRYRRTLFSLTFPYTPAGGTGFHPSDLTTRLRRSTDSGKGYPDIYSAFCFQYRRFSIFSIPKDNTKFTGSVGDPVERLVGQGIFAIRLDQ
jgi:hypothetical protein